MRVRQAEVADAPQIADLIQQAFGDVVSAERICGLLQSSQRLTLVADLNGAVIGFVDAFSTGSADGALRMELDLLAVHPEQRSRGIGRHLVMAVTGTIPASAIHMRALVAADNGAMRRLMQTCGYRQDEAASELLVAPVDAGVMFEDHAASHLIPVRTLTYDGIWIEADSIDGDLLAAANRLAAEESAEILGAVVPASNLPLHHQLLGYGFAPVGTYHWWFFTPGAGQGHSTDHRLDG